MLNFRGVSNHLNVVKKKHSFFLCKGDVQYVDVEWVPNRMLCTKTAVLNSKTGVYEMFFRPLSWTGSERGAERIARFCHVFRFLLHRHQVEGTSMAN